MAGRAPKVLLHPALAALVSISLGLPAAALAEDAEPPTPTSIVAESEPAEWVEIAPDDLLVIELAPDAAGRPREVVIQLLPPPFSQGWVENIRTLARAHWWEGTSVYRVIDNWLAQWVMARRRRPTPSRCPRCPSARKAGPGSARKGGAPFGGSGGLSW